MDRKLTVRLAVLMALSFHLHPVQAGAPADPLGPGGTEGATGGLAVLTNLARGVVSRLGETAILPEIKTVYPTGEKPLLTVAFKCPTELIGVSTPSTWALHGIIDLGMNGLNGSNLLPFNLQQVCS